MKRRFLAALLAVCLVLSVTGCEKKPAPTPTPAATVAPTLEPTAEPEPEPTVEAEPEPTAEPEATELEPPSPEPVTEGGVAAIAGTYDVDFASLGAPIVAKVNVAADGQVSATALIDNYDVSADGVVVESDGGYTLTETTTG
ncbi:MAG: hypothetical protein LBS19_11110, partial [Clostridiales bacterium]|nr:hypothetical protein [Clostridiales bacterium]